MLKKTTAEPATPTWDPRASFGSGSASPLSATHLPDPPPSPHCLPPFYFPPVRLLLPVHSPFLRVSFCLPPSCTRSQLASASVLPGVLPESSLPLPWNESHPNTSKDGEEISPEYVSCFLGDFKWLFLRGKGRGGQSIAGSPRSPEHGGTL